MKKRIFAVIVILLAVVLGIFAIKLYKQKQKEIQIEELAVPPAFSAQIKMQYDGTEYLCNVQKSGQFITVLIEESQRLNGISLNISRDEYTLSYMGMEIIGDSLPESISTAVSIIFDILEKMENMEYTSLEESEELITVNYSLGNAEFVCVYDKITGVPKEITVSELFKIEFLQFTVL